MPADAFERASQLAMDLPAAKRDNIFSGNLTRLFEKWK
jgi:hypothetical protein